MGVRGTGAGAGGHGRLGRRAQERGRAERAALAARLSDAVPARARLARYHQPRRCRTYLSGAARRQSRSRRARLGADREGRGASGAGRPRRSAHAVRAGPEGGLRHADGASGRRAAGAHRLRNPRVQPDRDRSDAVAQRQAGTGASAAAARAAPAGRGGVSGRRLHGGGRRAAPHARGVPGRSAGAARAHGAGVDVPQAGAQERRPPRAARGRARQAG